LAAGTKYEFADSQTGASYNAHSQPQEQFLPQGYASGFPNAHFVPFGGACEAGGFAQMQVGLPVFWVCGATPDMMQSQAVVDQQLQEPKGLGLQYFQPQETELQEDAGYSTDDGFLCGVH
jgi:hypothetical protein